MRKWMIGLLALVMIALLSVVIFIPKQLIVSNSITIKSSQYSIWRHLSDPQKWTKWWPAKRDEKSLVAETTSHNYAGYSFNITKLLYNAVDIQVSNKKLVSNGKLVMIPLSSDSILIRWQSALSASNNPFDRIQAQFIANDLQRKMSVILDSLKAFNEDKERVYKFNIRHTTLKDTALVATKKTTTNYPSVDVVYEMIDHLKNYVEEQGAKVTNYPMLNITKTDSNRYTAMVALATNKKLTDSRDIVFKRMIIYKDRVLTTDVKGGPDTIKNAYDEIKTYMNDYGLDVPVIHFEYLITDRRRETDTSKWITRINVPII